MTGHPGMSCILSVVSQPGVMKTGMKKDSDCCACRTSHQILCVPCGCLMQAEKVCGRLIGLSYLAGRWLNRVPAVSNPAIRGWDKSFAREIKTLK